MERRAGRAVGPEGLDPLEWELLIEWESRWAQYEALARSHLADIHAAILAKGKG